MDLAFCALCLLIWLFVRYCSASSVGVVPAPQKRTPPRKCLTTRTGKQYLVIGGHGFLGSHIVEALLARGETDITIFDMNASPLFESEQQSGIVKFIRGNILSSSEVAAACKGKNVVFHTAALVNYWAIHPFEYDPLYKINVVGTENVVMACIAGGVDQLIFVSTAVIFLKNDILHNPINNASEEALTYPSAADQINHYAHTKMLAEKAVLAANGRAGPLHAPGTYLRTVALRPNALFGPRDTFMTNTIIKASPGLGTPQGDNCNDYVYVENMVHAMLCAERAMDADVTHKQPPAGRAYFITSGPPIRYREFWKNMYAAYDPARKPFAVLPMWLADTLAAMVERIVKLTKGAVKLGELARLTKPPVIISRAHYTFDGSAAKRDFGYEPIYTFEEATHMYMAYLKEYYLSGRKS